MNTPYSTRGFIYDLEEALKSVIGKGFKDEKELEDLLAPIVNACSTDLEYVSERIYYHERMVVGDLECENQHPLFRINVVTDIDRKKKEKVITAIRVIPLNRDIMDFYLHDYIMEMDQLEMLSQLQALERKVDGIEDEKERKATEERIKLLYNMLT